MATAVLKSEMLSLRIKADERRFIDKAAKIAGKGRTAFILEAAREAAKETLLDRTCFKVDAETYAAFVAQLDAPVQTNENLRRTLQTVPPWENG